MSSSLPRGGGVVMDAPSMGPPDDSTAAVASSSSSDSSSEDEAGSGAHSRSGSASGDGSDSESSGSSDSASSGDDEQTEPVSGGPAAALAASAPAAGGDLPSGSAVPVGAQADAHSTSGDSSSSGSEAEDGSSSDDDDDDDFEDDEDEEEEPKLKYQRIGASVPEILQKDDVRCLCSHEKFLILGTKKGFLHILDLNGNEIMKFATHSGPINDISLDDAGDHCASCSDDGTVCITNLFTKERTSHNYHRAVRAVALHPDYEHKIMFATGGLGQQFIINTKGWFSSKDNVIHAGEGPIYCVRWKGNLVAWANEWGVKVYDVETHERITYISRPKGSPSADLYRCHLTWGSADTLLIGWADTVKIGVVRKKNAGSTASSSAGAAGGGAKGKGKAKAKGVKGLTAARYMAIVAMFQTDFYICGIAPFNEDLVLLAYVADHEPVEEHKGPASFSAQRPELRILSRANEEISSDALPIHGFEHYVAADYRLDYTAGDTESLFYIVSPKDIVVARPRDTDDHVTWLLDREEYVEALAIAKEKEAYLRHHKVIEIGEQYIKHLVDCKEYDEAAANCTKLLGQNGKYWETWIEVFAKHGQLKAIAPFIPVRDPVLSPAVYEMVLTYFLLHDHEGFLEHIRKWPHTIYSKETVITAVKKRLDAESSLPLVDALGQLFVKNNQYDQALHVYLELKRPDTFTLIRDLDLFDSVRDKVLQLMEFDAEEAASLLVHHHSRIPVDHVVKQLDKRPQLLHTYLHALFQKDTSVGQKYHQRQVALYAKYDRKQLLSFLRGSHFWVLEDALQTCVDNDLYPEQAFILKRMGNTNDALSIIIEKLRDVKQAIEFVEEHKDDSLWQRLISHSLSEPDFLSELLEHVGSHYVDPLQLIKQIPEDMHINGLKQKLTKILSDYALQVSLRKGCNNILKGDVVTLMEKFKLQTVQGISVEPSSTECALCQGPLVTSKTAGITVFFCRHAYHTVCIDAQRSERRAVPTCVHPNCVHTFHGKRTRGSARRQHRSHRGRSIRLGTSTRAVRGYDSDAALVVEVGDVDIGSGKSRARSQMVQPSPSAGTLRSRAQTVAPHGLPTSPGPVAAGNGVASPRSGNGVVVKASYHRTVFEADRQRAKHSAKVAAAAASKGKGRKTRGHVGDDTRNEADAVERKSADP